MLKIDKVELSGLIVLFVGVILLAFTFVSAYNFLIGNLTILASADITELFGRALAPLIEAIIHILYLGIMGWVGSILTIRAVQMVKREKDTTTVQPQLQGKPEAKTSVSTTPTDTKTETKKEPKPESKPEPKEKQTKSETKPTAPQPTLDRVPEPATKEPEPETHNQEKAVIQEQPAKPVEEVPAS